MESPWRPFDTNNIVDPYPMYAEMRDRWPVHKTKTGEWIVTRYDDVKTVLKDPVFRNGNRIDWLKRGVAHYAGKWDVFENILDATEPFIAFQHGQKHQVLRKLIMQAWNQREVDQIIRENIDELLAAIDPGSFDAVREVARLLPAMTIGRILGIPADDFRYLEEVSRKMVIAFDLYLNYRNFVDVSNSAGEFMSYFEKHIAIKEREPDNGLLSRLVQLNQKEKALTQRELVSNSFFLFLSGEETTACLISVALLHLAARQDKYQEIISHPEWHDVAVDEMLRFDSPAQLIARTATKDTELGGVPIKEGDLITACIGAGNRDPRQFDTPEELRLDRSPNRHLAFSQGAHYCLGDWLGKKELFYVLKAITARYKHLEVLKDPAWRENLSLRCLASLKLRAYN